MQSLRPKTQILALLHAWDDSRAPSTERKVEDNSSNGIEQIAAEAIQTYHNMNTLAACNLNLVSGVCRLSTHCEPYP